MNCREQQRSTSSVCCAPWRLGDVSAGSVGCLLILCLMTCGSVWLRCCRLVLRVGTATRGGCLPMTVLLCAHCVLLLLPRDEGTASAAAGRGPADLEFGGVQPQLDAFGLGVCEHIRQGPQPQAGPVRDRTSPLGRQPSHLTDRTGDGGAIDAEQQPQRRMRQIVPQMNQRGHEPVDEHQPMPETRSCLPLPGPAAGPVTTPLDHRLPKVGQLLNQVSEIPPRNPCEHLMRENRPTDHDRHIGPYGRRGPW